MANLPLTLYHISQSPSVWRRVYNMLYDLYRSDVPDPEVSLSRRDLLIEYGIPVEAWIDLRILETWFRKGVPIPLACLLGYILSLQREDGSFSVDGITPNSGATYRTIELSLLLGAEENPKVRRAVEFLIGSLWEGGLASPGPIEGALLEVGTTARFLHVLYRFDRETYQEAIESMRRFILSRACSGKDEMAWHTDLPSEELEGTDSCIGGATSLALYSLCLLGREEDRELIAKAVRWLLRRQKEGGGWSDSPEGSPNVDNTFNAVRALKASRDFLEPSLRSEVERSLYKAREFLESVDPYDLKTVSLRAMHLRAMLLLAEDPLDKKILRSLKALTDLKDRWFSREGHLYNEMLIAGIALGELLRSVRANPYRLAREGYEELKDLFSFPVEIPSLLPGHRDGVGERLLNFLAKAHRGYRLAEKLSESITVRDIVSLIIATFLMLGVFLSEDFLRALILPERDQKVDLYSTILVLSLYLLWLFIKFRFRESFLHFVSTTLLSILIALFLLWGWLRYSNEMVSSLLKEGEILPLLRVLAVFSLILDVGRRLINVSELDRIILSRRPGG